ncbi:alpha/beta fold hydrolase [Lacisediminihabitans profunda]|uniref:alpha/beta fold hydrolase n=1 Tax=Lacisediminihabitans profunda TaxID=2594790 RepID=UPI001C9CFE75|nr:alpha/beta hydrolase [Lacisediminihabitans profunda]
MPRYRGADDAELFFEDRGVGPPIVVVAGGGPRHPDYLEDLAGLGDHYRLIVPHLRGVGRTPATDGNLGSWWHESADIECLREHLGLDRVTIVAHSSGRAIRRVSRPGPTRRRRWGTRRGASGSSSTRGWGQ